MFKQVIFSAVRLATLSAKSNSSLFLQKVSNINFFKMVPSKNFTLQNNIPLVLPRILECAPKTQVVNTTIRTLTKYSMRKGKRKSVKAVTKRFYRLSWGIWIRTKAGRQKKLWKKTSARKRRLRQHVFCNATQSHMLDKMVGPYWRKRRFYVDDPYEPYHYREEYKFTSAKPRPYFPPEDLKL